MLQGIFTALLNSGAYAWLAKANEVTPVDSPRQLYHKRQTAVTIAFLVLSFSCLGDLALAVNFSDAASNYQKSSLLWPAAVIACIAG